MKESQVNDGPEYLADYFKRTLEFESAELKEMGIPETHEELEQLLNDSDSSGLQNYLKIIEDEVILLTNKTKIYSGDFSIVGVRARENLVNDINLISYFAEGVDLVNQAILSNPWARENLINIINIDDIKVGLEEMKHSYYNNYRSLEDAKILFNTVDPAREAAGVKLNRHNPEAKLESFKNAGVYEYEPNPEKLPKQTGRGVGKGWSSTKDYNKRKDTRVNRKEGDRINTRVQFNIPPEQKIFIAKQSNSTNLVRSTKEEKMLALESKLLNLKETNAPLIKIKQAQEQVNKLVPTLVKIFPRIDNQENISPMSNASGSKRKAIIDDYFSRKR